jgi:NAD(P)H dehydrogenase (quinone)
MYAITGASGQLGRLTIEGLLRTVSPSQVVAIVRNPEGAADLAAHGIAVRYGDYDQPETLVPALRGVSKLLLISSTRPIGRVQHHRAVIDAAKKSGITLIAYTSMLHAEHSEAKLAKEHWETEVELRASGIATTMLRNGWYTENYLMALQSVLATGSMYGAARDGRISLAARADYAAAAAAALTTEAPEPFYELAGDAHWTLADLALEIATQSGRPVRYIDLPQKEFEGGLLAAGLPEQLAEVLADADARAADGALFDDSHTLSRLIGRPATPVPQTVGQALQAYPLPMV